MADDIQVDMRVSPSLHPDNVKNIDGVAWDDDTAALLAPTYSAFEEAYRGIAIVHDAREAARRNPTLNEAAQVIATQDVADRVFARVAKAIDANVANLKKDINTIEKELTKPVEALAAHQISMEVRSFVSKMPQGERLTFLRRAINGGDIKTASAVLGAPSYLSGLNDELQAVMLREYHAKHYPQLDKRLKAMKGALTLTMDRGALLHRELERGVGKPSHEVERLRQAKLNAERALKSA